MSVCYFGCYPFGLEGGTMVLIAPVPGHCLPFTLCFKHVDVCNEGTIYTQMKGERDFISEKCKRKGDKK